MSKGRGKTAGKNRARNALTVLLVLLLCTASLLAGCQGVQIQPKGQIQTGVSVGGRR